MVLVTGSSGFVGNKIMKLCRDVVACPSLRGSSLEDIRRIIEESGADTVIHTAAISDVGACERDPDSSYHANVQIPVYLARACKNIKLICFSSDQVYAGAESIGPYTEDMAKPNNVYGAHKLEMEERVLDILPDSVMLRAEWMYDFYLKKSNYFMNILNAKDRVVFSSNQYRGITYVKEVAQSMERVKHLSGGVYNFGSETDKSMYEITRDFLDHIGKNITLNDIAEPKHNLWLNCEKARYQGVYFQSVEEGLKQCAEDYKHLI